MYLSIEVYKTIIKSSKIFFNALLTEIVERQRKAKFAYNQVLIECLLAISNVANVIDFIYGCVSIVRVPKIKWCYDSCKPKRGGKTKTKELSL